MNDQNSVETITLGAGCFWCVEAIFQQLSGVTSVVSGYSGGKIENPTYKAVCAGTTGHAEVCQVSFDNQLLSLEELLKVFFQTHDPTTLNRQGSDVGSQYRSSIFYHTDQQKEISLETIDRLNQSGAWSSVVVTEVIPFDKFFAAEDYHQDYFDINGDQPYCKMVIQPKLKKFEEAFGDMIKSQ